MSVFASRYARAFADVVRAAKLAPSEVDQHLADFAATLAGSAELREVLENPSFPLEKKVAILDEICERIGAEPQVRNLLAVLVSHDRIASFPEILSAYRHEIDQRLGIAEVTIISARKLEAAERKGLQERITLLAGGKVRAEYEIDGSLLGGAIVRIGSKVYDGSVRGQLDRLKQLLVAG
jgi:F-type H+-transporting ATPase subunit delta